jgi:hypothetical protein
MTVVLAAFRLIRIALRSCALRSGRTKPGALREKPMPPDALTAEFDLLAAKAGLDIPPDRREALLLGYADMKRIAQLLRTTNLTAADEPANIYTFANIVEGEAH